MSKWQLALAAALVTLAISGCGSTQPPGNVTVVGTDAGDEAPSQEQQEAPPQTAPKEPRQPDEQAPGGDTAKGEPMPPIGQASAKAEPQSDAAALDKPPSGSVTIAPSSFIGVEAAGRIALARVPGAQTGDLSIALDHDDGQAHYEGRISYADSVYDFEIDAASGAVLEWEAERVQKKDDQPSGGQDDDDDDGDSDDNDDNDDDDEDDGGDEDSGDDDSDDAEDD